MSYEQAAEESLLYDRLLSRRLILFAAAVRQATSGEVLSRKLGVKVTDAQADALRFLILNENTTIGEVAVGLGLTISGATKAVNRIEANVWVERFNKDDDHRTVYVRLTEKGRELAEHLISETELRINRILQRLRPETVQKLDGILESFLRDFIDDGEIATKLCIACGFKGGIHCCESDVDCVVAKTVQQIEPEKHSVR